VSVPISGLAISQTDVKKALLNGTFNVGVLTLIEASNKVRGSVEPLVVIYENVDFHDLVTIVMQAYERAVSEDLISPVVARMEDVLRNFVVNVAVQVSFERLKEALELEDGEGGSYEP